MSSEIAAPCPGPQTLPNGGLTQAEVERFWSRDRVNLVRCRDAKGAIVRFYEDLGQEFLKVRQ